MSLKGKHRYHALWSVKSINRKGILFLVKPSEQSVWVKTQLEQIHPLRWTYRQTRCAEISARWHLCQNQYGNFPSMAGCPPMLMRPNLLRTEVFCWPFLAVWEIFRPEKNHILWTILPLFQIFPPYWLVWPFSWPFMIHLCRMCAKIFGAIIHLHHWNHQLHHACIIQLHNTPAENFSAKADLLQICWWKCFFFSLAMKTFGHGEHLLIKFGQKWEVTNCTIADFIL